MTYKTGNPVKTSVVPVSSMIGSPDRCGRCNGGLVQRTAAPGGDGDRRSAEQGRSDFFAQPVEWSEIEVKITRRFMWSGDERVEVWTCGQCIQTLDRESVRGVRLPAWVEDAMDD